MATALALPTVCRPRRRWEALEQLRLGRGSRRPPVQAVQREEVVPVAAESLDEDPAPRKERGAAVGEGQHKALQRGALTPPLAKQRDGVALYTPTNQVTCRISCASDTRRPNSSSRNRVCPGKTLQWSAERT